MCNICVKNDKYIDCNCNCSAVHLYIVKEDEIENNRFPIKCSKCGHYINLTNLKRYTVKVIA